MKTETYKPGQKDFEKEKSKMFESPAKGLNREDQLNLVFNHILKALMVDYEMSHFGGLTEDEIAKKYTNILLTEVKVRVNLK